MIWFKRCPKCHGDLAELSDHYGKFVACLQCSYELSELEERFLHLGVVPVPVKEAVTSADAGTRAAA
jgi:hypothetical protein